MLTCLRWSIAHGKLDDAKTVLARLDSTTENDPRVLAELAEIQAAIELEKKSTFSAWKLLTGRSDSGTQPLRRFILSCASQAFQQLGGINVLSYFMAMALMTSLGIDETQARMYTAACSVSYTLASIAAIWLVDKVGRRKLMIWGAGGQSICFTAIAILVMLQGLPQFEEKKKLIGSATIPFFFLFYIVFGCTWQGIPWLYQTETNSLSMRTMGSAWGTATNWMCNFAVVEITPMAMNSLGWKFYLIFGVLNLLWIPLLYFFFAETSNRTLEDIDAFYRESRSFFVHRDKDATCATRPEKYIERDVEIKKEIEEV